MDFARSFSYVTEDADWLKKTLIAALLLLVGIGAPAVIGWMLEIVRRVSNGAPNPLPEWDNLGEYFIAGLKLMVIGLVWMLPVIIIAGIFGGGAALMGNGMDENIAGIVFSLGGICMALLLIVYSIIVWLLSGPLTAQLSEGVMWTKLFNPKPSFDLLKRNLGGYLVAALLGNVIINILATIGTILCGVGSFWGGAFGTAVMAHLLGQAHAQAKAVVLEA